MERVQIRGLPKGDYQVQCKTTDGWEKLVRTILPNCLSVGTKDYYYKFEQNGSCDLRSSKYDVEEVQYEDWKEAIETHIRRVGDFKVGDIVYITKGYFDLSAGEIRPLEGFDGQHWWVSTKNYAKIYLDIGENFRHATKEEIAAQSKPPKHASDTIADYTYSNIKGKKIAIHCPTQELWNKVISLIPKCRLVKGSWDFYKEKSCITHNEFNGSYGNTEFYKDEGYQIITAEEFIAANEKKPEYKVDDWVVVTHNTGGDPVGTVTQIVRIGSNDNIHLRNTSKDKYPNVDKWVHGADTFRPATPDEISKAKGSTTSKVRVDKTNAVIGLKVVRGKDWDYSLQDGGEGNVGVITEYPLYYPKDPGSDWTYVVWVNGDGYCYRIGEEGKYDLYVHEEQVVSRTSRPVKPKYDTPIGWKPGDSWRHRDGSCGLSISVFSKADNPNEFFVDFGEYGTAWTTVEKINEFVAEGTWIINPEEKSKKQESQTIINSKQSKTKQNENIKEGISISTEQCIISKRGYKPKSSAYLPADSARVTAGSRRKGTAVRG